MIFLQPMYRSRLLTFYKQAFRTPLFFFFFLLLGLNFFCFPSFSEAQDGRGAYESALHSAEKSVVLDTTALDMSLLLERRKNGDYDLHIITLGESPEVELVPGYYGYGDGSPVFYEKKNHFFSFTLRTKPGSVAPVSRYLQYYRGYPHFMSPKQRSKFLPEMVTTHTIQTIPITAAIRSYSLLKRDRLVSHELMSNKPPLSVGYGDLKGFTIHFYDGRPDVPEKAMFGGLAGQHAGARILFSRYEPGHYITVRGKGGFSPFVERLDQPYSRAYEFLIADISRVRYRETPLALNDPLPVPEIVTILVESFGFTNQHAEETSMMLVDSRAVEVPTYEIVRQQQELGFQLNPKFSCDASLRSGTRQD